MISSIDIEAFKEDKQGRIPVRVFPDDCASCFWESPKGYNINEQEILSVLPEALKLAINWWEMSWHTTDGLTTSSSWFVVQWNKHGERLVELMNEAQNKYQFTYVWSL